MGGDKRFDADEAMPVAAELLEDLRPFVLERPPGFPWFDSHLITIAGSLRRMKDNVGDIELLYVPRLEARQKDFFSTEPMNLAEERIALWLEQKRIEKRLNVRGAVSSWGTLNKHAVHVESGIPVDLFATTAANWFVSLVIRTGGKETNLMLTTGANRLNRTLHAYGSGVTQRWPDGTTDELVAASEQDVFKLCGCEYVEPHRRR